VKTKRGIVWYSILFFLVMVSRIYAQEITFTATVDRNIVPMGEYVMLSVSVSGSVTRIPKPKLPAIKDFDILSKGSSRNISFVNGKISSSLSYNYALVPKEVGKFTIGECEIEIKGKVYRSEPIDIEVVPEGTKTGVTGPSGGTFPPPFTKKNEKDRSDNSDLYIKTSVNKRNVYTGEEIILTFRFYSRAHVLSQLQYYPPATKGFWKEDIGKENQYQKQINGKVYDIVELKYALFPITEGTLTVGEAQLNCVVDDFSAAPFGFSTATEKKLTSKPINITVLPLPSAPDGFSGAVGEFTITAELDKDHTKQNEPVTVITLIRGEGNLRNIDMSEIDIPGFKTYNSGSEVELIETDNSLVEVKTNKTILVPFRSGDFEVPERSFVYFDPKKKEFITKSTRTLSFKVLPGEGGEEIDRLYGKGGIEEVGRDIHFLKGGERVKSESTFDVTKYFLVVNVLLLSLFVGIFLSQVVRDRMRSQEHILRKRNALRNSLHLLTLAKREARRGDIKEGYELLHKSILQFFADKRNLSVWGTTEDEIRTILQENSIGEKVQGKLFAIIDICNRARFSKETSGISEFNKYQSQAIKLLKSIKVKN
jgi:hypothetical protein